MQVAKVCGVRLGVAGAGDVGGAAGREARVLLAVEGARVNLLGLVTGGVAAAVGYAVRVVGVDAPRGAGGEGAAVYGMLEKGRAKASGKGIMASKAFVEGIRSLQYVNLVGSSSFTNRQQRPSSPVA